MHDNPYEAPAARIADLPVRKEPEEDRREHLQRESGLRGVGVVCLACTAYLLVVFVLGWIGTDGGRQPEAPMGLLALGTLTAVATWGYLRLCWWVRLPAIAVATIVLFMTAFLTTPLVAYAAWLTWSKKGRRVLDTDYAYVRALTPGLQAWRQPGEALLVVGMFVAYILLFVFVTNYFSRWD